MRWFEAYFVILIRKKLRVEKVKGEDMCDTIVALPNSTRDKNILFGKNSDREFNEAHVVLTVPAQDHPQESKVRCTYIEIPQVAHTHAILLTKPYWIWGAEMGGNEWGVTIGNEAIFSKVPAKKEPGLIGMDFLRLALERSKSAEEALKVIVNLLEIHGQSGNCSLTHGLYYHNSYIIADRKEAWVLETVDRDWAALRVKTVYAISNGLTIGSHWDEASDNLVLRAIDKGWCKNKNDFHFARCYSDLIFTKFSQARQRSSCALGMLNNLKGQHTESTFMAILRSHGNSGNEFRPDKSIFDWTICMHQGWGPFRSSQSVGSMVSRLGESDDTHWITGTSAPCTSFYKPVWLDSGLPQMEQQPTNVCDKESLWWTHELFHRYILKDYANRMQTIQEQRDLIESRWLIEEYGFRKKTSQQRRLFTDSTFKQSIDLTREWFEKMKSSEIINNNTFYYQSMLDLENKRAGIQ